MSSLAAGLMRPKGQEHAGLCGSKWLREPRGCPLVEHDSDESDVGNVARTEARARF